MLRNISGRPWLLGLVLLLAWGPAQRACAYGNASGSTNDTPLIDASKIDSRQLATLSGTVPLQVSKSKDLGAMGQTEVIPSMTLVLKRSPELQNRFNAYVASLNDPASPNFHQWLTAEQIGQQFGPNASDVTTVTKWLNSQGLGVKSVSPDRMRILFPVRSQRLSVRSLPPYIAIPRKAKLTLPTRPSNNCRAHSRLSSRAWPR